MLLQSEDLSLKKRFEKYGFVTRSFSQELRLSMLKHIDSHIRELGAIYTNTHNAPLEKIAESIPDEVWTKKMHRGFRMFPDELAHKLQYWADESVRKPFGKDRSSINAVSAYEVELNKSLSTNSLAIYWRCVRPGKPDAGRPHRDATFWILELEDGYDPKIPFPFDPIRDSIKIWIPLQGCTPSTSLQIIPQSHRMKIATVVDETEYGRKPNIDREWLKDHEKDFISPIELSKGECILFDMDLVHRGPTHNNTELRISAELTLIVK